MSSTAVKAKGSALPIILGSPAIGNPENPTPIKNSGSKAKKPRTSRTPKSDSSQQAVFDASASNSQPSITTSNKGNPTVPTKGKGTGKRSRDDDDEIEVIEPDQVSPLPPLPLATSINTKVINNSITENPDSGSEIEDSDEEDDIIWEERTLGNLRSDWKTVEDDIPKPTFLGIRDAYPDAWTHTLSENIKNEYHNKSKFYVLAAFAGARKNDFKLRAIIQAANATLKYPKPAITESEIKDITLGNNPWYILKLHTKEQANALTKAGFVYTADVGNAVTFRPPLVKPQTLSAFSLKVSRSDGYVTSEYIQSVIQENWPQITEVSVSDAPIGRIWWFVLIKQASPDSPPISQRYTVTNGEILVKKAEDCKICHSHLHPASLCPMRIIRQGWNLDLGETTHIMENKTRATTMIGAIHQT